MSMQPVRMSRTGIAPRALESGERFGMWTALAEAPRGIAHPSHRPRPNFPRKITCRCDCGTVRDVLLFSLVGTRKPSRNCGCVAKHGRRRGLTRKQVTSEATLRAKYGITLAHRDAMIQRQNGRCAICHKLTEKLCVDHCHKTGQVRGMLCNQCNYGIGQLKDSITVLRDAIQYLGADCTVQMGCSG